jgi:hypothetical protein
MRTYKNKWNIRAGPEGNYGTFTDIIAGFHNAPSGNVVAGRGNAQRSMQVLRSCDNGGRGGARRGGDGGDGGYGRVGG